MLYSMLPAIVQTPLSYLSILPNLAGNYPKASHMVVAKNPLGDSESPCSKFISIPSRKPRARISAPAVLEAPPSQDAIAIRSLAAPFDDENLPHRRSLARPSSSSHTPTSAMDYKTGILWKFAYQGSALLALAVEESESISRGPNDGNAEFARQLYLDALSYLLRALPADLRPEEQLSLHSSIPPGVTQPMRVEITQEQFLEMQGAGTNESVRPEQSILHRSLASAIVSIFLFVHFALPYLQLVLRKAYDYDRTNHISEKLLVQGLNVAHSTCKTGLRLWHSILDPGYSRFGPLLNGAAVWCIEGIGRGVYDGVGEGMGIIGMRNQPPIINRSRD